MPQETARQVAALPMRTKANGKTEVLLITSLYTRRWLVPKGWPESGLKMHESAAAEAHEEAGVRGKIGSHPIGTYRYLKILPNGRLPVEVSVYELAVRSIENDWPEAAKRKRRWFSPLRAAEQVQEPELRKILRSLAKRK